MSPMVEGEVERAKRKRATVIVTRWIRITINSAPKAIPISSPAEP